MRLKDKVVLITGAGGGIGETTALRFAEEGAIVVVNDVNQEGAQRVVDAIKTKGTQALANFTDVTNKAQVEAMIKEIVEKYQKLDIIINNAGITRDAFVRKMEEKQWDQVININLKGTFLVSQAGMMPMMQARYGKIVNTASISALGNLGQINYSASKAGVIGLTKTLALELARYKINVNCVAPGAVKTAMTAQLPEKVVQEMTKRIPFRRFAEPTDVAKLHVFLASDDASYITGQVIFVDGGMSVGN